MIFPLLLEKTPNMFLGIQSPFFAISQNLRFQLSSCSSIVAQVFEVCKGLAMVRSPAEHG
jgi:hypothetical protein